MEESLALERSAKHKEIKIIPIQPMGVNFSPTNAIANIAATALLHKDLKDNTLLI